jgi:hypothetical protein
MSHPAPVKPTDKAIRDYYAALEKYAEHSAAHEGATETAFSNLLAVTAKPRGWTLIPKKKLTVRGTGKTVYPDGTPEDEFYLPRGYWEAKDTDDDLDAEVKKKIARGYPLTRATAPGSPTTSRRACPAYRSPRTSGRSPPPASSSPTSS